MTVTKASAILGLITGLALTGWVMAQDDQGFEALLKDITKPADSNATPAPAAAETTTAQTTAPASEPAAAPAATEQPAAASTTTTTTTEQAPGGATTTTTTTETMPAADVQPEVAPAAVTEQPAAEAAPAASAPAETTPTAAEGTPAVAAAPAAEAAPAPALTPEQVAEARTMSDNEEVRRQAKEVEGKKSLDAGEKALAAGDFDTAIRDFELAYANLPERPATKKQRDQARGGLGEAYYKKAADIYRKEGNLADAKASVDQAILHTPDNGNAVVLKKRIEDEQAHQAEIAARPIPPKERAEFKEKTKTINELMAEGRQFYKIADYDNAEAVFEKILQEDEYNTDAMRYLRKIDEVRFDIKSTEFQATSAERMKEVRDAWNPPIRKDVVLPMDIQQRKPTETITSTQKLQEKMQHIVIPAIEFRQANINDVINFLVEESIKQDTVDNSGVNIILNLSVPGAEAAATPAPAAAADNPFGAEATAPGADTGAAVAVPTITLNLRRISLLDAIRYITEVAQLKFRLEGNAVIITPEGVVSGHVVTRFYPVQPSFLDVIIQKADQPKKEGDFVEMGAGQSTMKKSDVKEFFERAGVPFPAGTSITYNQSISQLIVANTPENLENFERILSRLNVVPNQVEIEARFVEIAQDDLEEMGLQWILTDNYTIAQKTSGNAPLGGQESVQVNADPNGFTKGLRFFNFNRNTGTLQPNSAALAAPGLQPLGGIATIASVLTNPELSVIIQAISQHGGTDLLSAPRVTTRSGVNAQIQVVKEIIYPTEFETTQPQFSNSGGTSTIVTPPLVTPGSFETRETGVILNVTPTVGPDGYTIDLTLVPEVSELVDWIQYGSTFGNFSFNIPQPIFTSRNVTTSIVIWDGQTVVMGGLIREELIRVKDKIPILGDIPILGKLFQSNGSSSQKRNLLIFVTARLVDPAGKPIHRGEVIGVAEKTETAEAAGAPK